MHSSNLVKVLIITFLTISIGCSKGGKDSNGNETWNPRDAQKLLNDIKNYKPMDSEKYNDAKFMVKRDEYIARLFPGDPVAASFSEFLNADYKNQNIEEVANNFIDLIISFSFDHRKSLVDHNKDMQIQQGDEGIESRMSETDKLSIMFQLAQIVGELKKTQSNGKSYWGDRDTSRVATLNKLIQERRENEIDYEFNARIAGFGAMAVVGGVAFVILPKAFNKRNWAAFFNFMNDASQRILGLIQKTPLKNIVTKGKDIHPTDIVKYTHPGDIVSRIPRFLLRNLTLTGEARVHYSNTLKIRHHFANLLYSVGKKSPSRWKLKKFSKQPPEEVMNISEQVKLLSKGINNIAFNPRFAAQTPTPEDHAIHYFVTAHRVSKDQLFPQANYSKMYQDAIDEIDLSKKERSEFKRQFTKLVSDNSDAAQKYKNLAVDTEQKYLLAQKSLITGTKSRKKFGEYGEELEFAWNPGEIAMTEVVYTNNMINRLVKLKEGATSESEIDFLNQAIELVYKSQKYDVINISGMRLILKKNQGQVEKVFVGRPMGYSESTVYELATVVPDQSAVQPIKQTDNMSQEDFLEFMNQTSKSIRDGKVLTRVVNNTEVGMAPVGYLSLSNKVGKDIIARGLKRDYKDVFDISRLEKGKQGSWLARKFKNAASWGPKKIRQFRNSGSTQTASEVGKVWISKLYNKPNEVEKVISAAKNKVDSDIDSIINTVDSFTAKSIEKDLNLSASFLEASDSLKQKYILDAIEKVDKHPFAHSLKNDLKNALKKGVVEPEIEAVKTYLKKIASKHSKTQHENVDKVVTPMLRDQEFLAKMVKYLASNPDAAKGNLNAMFFNHRQRGIDPEVSVTEVFIDLYHSINDLLNTDTGRNYAINQFDTNMKKEIDFLKFYEEDSAQWMPSFYDRHFKGIATWTDNKFYDGLILLGGALSVMGVAEAAKQEVFGIDLHSGMFIDDSMSTVNWQSLTESSEYELFERATIGRSSRY